MVTKPNIGEEGWGPVLNAALDELETDRIAGDDALASQLIALGGYEYIDGVIDTTVLPENVFTKPTLIPDHVGDGFSVVDDEILVPNDGLYDIHVNFGAYGSEECAVSARLDAAGIVYTAHDPATTYLVATLVALNLPMTGGQTVVFTASTDATGPGNIDNGGGTGRFVVRRVGQLPS